MNYTTIEQSKKLLELGLSPESADMFWFRDDTEVPKIFPKDMMHNSASVTYPCWSVGALLEMLPFPVLYQYNLAGTYFWRCEIHFIDDEIRKAEDSIDLIDVAVSAVEEMLRYERLCQ